MLVLPRSEASLGGNDDRRAVHRCHEADHAYSMSIRDALLLQREVKRESLKGGRSKLLL